MSEWISVKDRLPEIDIQCLVWHKNWPFRFLIASWSEHDDSFVVCNIENLQLHSSFPICVTHWMLIPEPPKVK